MMLDVDLRMTCSVCELAMVRDPCPVECNHPGDHSHWHCEGPHWSVPVVTTMKVATKGDA